MCRFLVDLIRSYLKKFACLETVRCECPTEATSSIQSDSIFSHTESLCCPVSIYDKFFSSIVLVPGPSFMNTYHTRYLWWSCESIIRMESSMHHDKILSFNNIWKSLEPVTMLMKISCYTGIFRDLLLDPIPPTLSESLEGIYMCNIKKCKIFMITCYTPCIRTVADIFNNFMWLGSLVNEISDEVEMIILSYTSMSNECDEFIITSMYIPDKKSSLLHALDYRGILENSKSIFLRTTAQIRSFSFYILPTLGVLHISPPGVVHPRRIGGGTWWLTNQWIREEKTEVPRDSLRTRKHSHQNNSDDENIDRVRLWISVLASWSSRIHEVVGLQLSRIWAQQVLWELRKSDIFARNPPW